MIRTYSEMNEIESFEDRYSYLKLNGSVGDETFGFDRYLNQKFYRSSEWKRVRDFVIVRDNGCDLAHPDRPIAGKIYIHHMNPVEKTDIISHNESILDPEFLVCVSKQTHDAIHFGDKELLPKDHVGRRPNDTCPWKR